MALVIRMKNVSRALIFLGSLIVWVVVLSLVNDLFLNIPNDYLVLSGAALVGLAQTWIVAQILGT
jgi:hypothetical protein